jgi:hypothetical protein
MSRSINDAYTATPNFLQDLIIAYSPLGILQIKLAEYVLKRFFRLRRGGPGTQTLSKKAAQTKTAPDTRRRPTLRAGERLLLQTN